MKNLFPAILITGLIYMVNLSGFTEPVQTNVNISKVNVSGLNVDIKALYALGKVPVNKGMPDTLEINVANDSPNEYIKLKISIYNRNDNSLLDEDEVQIQAPGTYDTTIYYPIPRYFQPKNNKIVVEAIPGSALDDNISLIDTVYDSAEICQDITWDTYNYADPCLADNGGFGFPGRKANFVAAFRNKDSLPILIGAVEQKFFDSVGGGFKPYNIVIYADNGLSKPGSLIYKSPNLLTPAGTGSVVTLPPYTIDTLLTVQPGKRFFVGYRQTSTSSIKAAFQNEVPIRDSSFFFTTSDTGNVWYDFRDSSKNSKIDIAAVVSNVQLNLKFNFEACAISGTITAELRSSTSPYNLVDSINCVGGGNISSVANFSNAVNGTPYYVVIKSLNSIETWSATTVTFSSYSASYDFTTSVSKAYGNNQILSAGIPSIYQGDANQDGFVDLTDVTLTYNQSSTFTTSISTDYDCNGTTDLTDLVLSFNNSSNFISVKRP